MAGGRKKFWRRLRRNRNLTALWYPYYRLKTAWEVQRHPFLPDPFLDQARGILHVGGHHGGEILDYAKRKLRVLWVEANPEIFSRLLANLRGVPRQKALLGLLGSEERNAREFYVASNDGASSSVFLLDPNESLWPEIRIEKKLLLPQLTLPGLLRQAGLREEEYDTLVLDVQGAELDILKGVPRLAETFPRIQLEAANFPLYQGAPVLDEIDDYLRLLGYRPLARRVFASDQQGRQCMDCRYALLPP